MLFLASFAFAVPLIATAAGNFHVVALDRFINRPFVTYGATESWGMVPRGDTNFDGVPFRFTGKVDLTGLGRARDGEFQLPRAGEILVGKRAARLHLIHGASYDSPDDTPIACALLHYTNGISRKLFIRYGVHVRNWYVEASEKDSNVRDPRSTVVWRGNTGPAGGNKPLRLFKTTFDNPIPAQEIRALELLTLFARANPVFVAITLEESSGAPASSAAAPDEDDSPFRREATVRVLGAATGQPLSNATMKISVLEGTRQYRFGTYQSDARGNIRLDYPPGKFMVFLVDMSAAGHRPASFEFDHKDGVLNPDLPVRLIPETDP
jgi:hypothetical protein